ncbi:MAG: AAA family ATPase [Kurthia sp.]|nr:AAA family ATPase [Candidatus Kurthia equi]
MRITKLHMYGFGQHSDEVIELNRQFTLLYGLNEAGKTTIYEFILQILFGFPQKNHLIKSYEPKRGGTFGGKLIIEDEQYGHCVVERLAGKAKGIVKVQLENGEVGDESLLAQLLRGYSRADMEAIFAFSMHELQHLDKMTQDELNRTLLASGTTGIEQVTKLEKQLNKESQALFKKSGQNPLINRQVKEIQQADQELKEERQRIEQYKPKHDQQLELKNQLQFLENEQAKLNKQIQEAQLYLQYEPLVLQKHQAEEALEPLIESRFPTNGIQRFEQNEARMQQIQQELILLERRSQELKRELHEVADEQQLQKMHTWLRNDEQWRQWRMQRDQLLSQLQKLETQIEMKKQLLGIDRAVLKVDSSLANEVKFTKQLAELDEIKQQLNYYKQAIQESENELQNLERAEQQHAQRRKNKSTKPQQLKNPGLISACILIVSLICAIIFQQWGILLGGIVVSAIVYFISRDKKATDLATSNLPQLKKKIADFQHSYEKVSQKQQQLNNQLQAYFQKVGLNGVVDSEIYRTLFQNLRTLQEQTIEQQQLDAQLDLVQQQITAHYETGCQLLNEKVPEAELSSVVQQTIQKQELELKALSYTQQQLKEVEQQLVSISQQLEHLQQQQQELFTFANVADDEGYYKAAQYVETKQQLQQQVEQLEQQLSAIPTIKPYTISQLDELQAQYEWNKQQYAETLKQHATLSAEVQHLVKDEHYSVQLQHQEERKGELQDNMKKWVRIKIIEQAIQDILEEMKERKLPNVLENASDFFAYLTADRYKKLIFVDTNFVAVNKEDDHYTISELSQATKEQAYLALRFALAKEKFQTAPFPLLMDDPFVHFDTLRTAKVVQLLRKLQSDHQILFFTCQERMKTDFNEQNIIEVRALQTKGD